MARKPAKSGKNQQKKRGFYTPEPVRDRVVALHLAGQSNCEIAKVEKIDRGTISKILSHEEAVQMIARQRSRLQCMGDKALDVIEQSLSSDDSRLAVPVAMKILEHVLPKGSVEETIDLAKKASPEEPHLPPELQLLATMIAGSLHKSQVYGQPLTPRMEEVIRDLLRLGEKPEDAPMPSGSGQNSNI